MNARQIHALANHCRLAGESSNPEFAKALPDGTTTILSVNTGWE